MWAMLSGTRVSHMSVYTGWPDSACIVAGVMKPHAACVMIVGRNPLIADPPQWMAIKQAKARGARLLVIDPFQTSAAEMADLWLRPRPGTDGAIALAMTQVLIDEELYDRDDVVIRHERSRNIGEVLDRSIRYAPAQARAMLEDGQVFSAAAMTRALWRETSRKLLVPRAWRDGVSRVHVHTCSLDHPAALAAYTRAGFTPYKRAIERFPDPRLAGILPRDCAPQVPLLPAS